MTTTIVPVITDAGRQTVINAAATGFGPAVISHVGFGDGAYTPTAARTAMQGERRRVPASGGAAVAPHLVHVTAIEDGGVGYELREIGFFLSDGTLFAVYSHPTAKLADKVAGVDFMLAFDLSVQSLPAGSLTVQPASLFNIPPATETVMGVAEIATQKETNDGVDDERIVTPKKLAVRLAWLGQDVGTNAAPTFLGGVTIGNNILGPSTGHAYTISADPAASVTQGAFITMFASGHAGAPGTMMLGRGGNTEMTLDGAGITFARTPKVGGWNVYHEGNLPTATAAQSGVVELATVAEAQARTDTARAVTPAGLAWLGQDVGTNAAPTFLGGVTIGNNILGPSTGHAYTISADPAASVTQGAFITMFASGHAGAPGTMMLGRAGVTEITIDGAGAKFGRTPKVGGWNVYHEGNLPTATAAQSGVVELATVAEVEAGTDTARAVTPAGLASLTATETRAGLVELATVAEAQARTDTARAVTPAGLAWLGQDVGTNAAPTFLGGVTIGNNILGPSTGHAYTISADPAASVTQGAFITMFASGHAGAPGTMMLGRAGVTEITIDGAGAKFGRTPKVGGWNVYHEGNLPNALRNMIVFAASGTFTAPAGVTRIRVRLWGGGGGGGGAANGGQSGGGAGGGYAEGVFDVTPGQSYAVTVGAAGAGGNGTPSNGTGGGTSSFGVVISATGGVGGLAGNGGFGGASGIGGGGYGGSLVVAGQSGSGGSAYAAGGAGGGTFGGGGAPSGSTGGTGASGSTPGGGGGGTAAPAGQGYAGGAGGAGLVIVEY